MPGYVNPLSQVQGLVPERVDQGVDFRGNGPVLALGDAQIIETSGQGWPGGPFLSYRLLDGPDAGKSVYVAENFRPSVTPGQHVTAGAVIGSMFNGADGIETGWADSSGTSPLSQSSEAGSISGANLPPGGTLVGRDFENLLRSLGVPAANNLSASPGGTLPSASAGTASPASAPSGSGGSACLGFQMPGWLGGNCLGTQVPTFASIEHTFFGYLERAGLFILGGILILVGVWMLFKDSSAANSVKNQTEKAEDSSSKEVTEAVKEEAEDVR